MSNAYNIDILLSTYNGEKYLDVLLDSLINQTYRFWQLIVRDDGSTDRTMEIIERYSIKYPITIIQDNEKHLGACQSFAKLLLYSNVEYIMFCDQDDVWLPLKIEKSLHDMVELEFFNYEKPLLIHSDLKVVDSELNIISSSFLRYQNLNPNKVNLNNLLIQNVVTGCTMMINKKLKNMAQSVPQAAIMHDWWFALIASAFGKIGYNHSSYILYRQHYSNDTGAKRYNIKHFLSRLKNMNIQMKSILQIINQGEAFLLKYKPLLNSHNYEIATEFTTLLKQSRWHRLNNYYKYDFKKNGKIRTIGFMLLLLYMKKQP